MEKLIFTPSGDDRAAEFYVVEQTRVAGVNYLLVTDEPDGDGDAWILKDLSEDGDPEALCEEVEDDAEREALAKIFSEMLEDVDIEV